MAGPPPTASPEGCLFRAAEYCARSSRDLLPARDVCACARPYDRDMRTDRGWRRFYAAGWLVSAAFGAVASVQWHARLREVEKRAEEAERTRDEAARRRALRKLNRR